MASVSKLIKIGHHQISVKFSHGQKWAWSFEHDPDVWEVVSWAKSILGTKRNVSAKYVIILKICRWMCISDLTMIDMHLTHPITQLVGELWPDAIVG
jgi:hypothetical protein